MKIDCNYRYCDLFDLISLINDRFIEFIAFQTQPKSVYTNYCVFFYVITPNYICSMRFVYFLFFDIFV